MVLVRLLAVTAVTLASLPALSQKSANPSDAIASLRAEWARDLHDKRLGQIVALYAPDAVFLPPNGERITGRDAIRELTRKAMDSFTSDLALHSLNFDSSGTLAYDSGEFNETLTSAADGSTSHGEGNYVMVCKRQPDGNWLIVELAWTASAIARQ